MSEKGRRFVEPVDESMLFDRLSTLRGFDRCAYRFARILQVTGGVTVKSPSKGKAMTATDVAYAYLKRVDARNFDSGKSAAQVAKATGYQRITISNALNELVRRGILKSEKRGRRIRYFLSGA